jgi:hypothetical protein
MSEESSAEVRGIALIGIREYVQSHLNAGDLSRFLNSLPFEASYTILNAEKGSWYPFSIESQLHQHIVKCRNPKAPHETMLDLGAFVAEYEINSFLRGLFSFLPLRLILNRFQSIWSKLYRPGNFVLRSSRELGAVFELAGFHSDPLFCHMVEAWLRVAGKHLKLENMVIKETACIHRGAGLCRWEVSWQTAKTLLTYPSNHEVFAGRRWVKGS